jgi:hypothetical protein
MKIRHSVETQSQRKDNIRAWARRLTMLGEPPTDDEIWTKVHTRFPACKGNQKQDLVDTAKRTRANAQQRRTNDGTSQGADAVVEERKGEELHTRLPPEGSDRQAG